MRDYRKFFRQLCIAMGIVVAGPVMSCSSPEANTQVAEVGTTSDSGASDVPGTPGDPDSGSATDVDGPPEDGQANEDTGGVPDVVAVEDAGPADILVADDSNVVIDSGAIDAAGPDVPTVDAGTHDTGADDVGVGEPDVDEALCDWGTPGEPVCYSAEALQNNIDNPPFGGKPGDEPYAGPLPPEGCPDPALVLDGCCNPGVGVPELKGTECCYVHCEGSCCGRPFVIDGETRVAGLVADSVWANDAAPVEVAPEVAAALASAWRQDAQDEHASVASFMRFGLELMHVGAPPELVAGAATAAADEVRHAQLTLSVATSLDGRRIGPGALSCADVLPRSSWTEIVLAAIAEGCVGETLAAAQVAAAARGCTNPELRETLQGIAEDEGRHAELAWRFIAWSWREGATEVRDAIRTGFARAENMRVAGDPREDTLVNVSDMARRNAGRLGSAEAKRINEETMRMVVLPCAAALLAEV